MIIRENEKEFIMIHQHDHAIISEKITKEIEDIYFPNERLKESTLFAIGMHDCGWINFDYEPLWNEATKTPYTFIDFPIHAKTVVYKHGIDMVEEEDRYAALLCSKHYTNFLSKESLPVVDSFLHHEHRRRKRIISELDLKDNDLFHFHYDWLKFADGFSLFLCLNDTGSKTVHPFFKNGIPLPKVLVNQLGARINLEWIDETTLSCRPFIFKKTLHLTISQKRVLKDDIAKKGFLSSYQRTDAELVEFKITE